MEINSRKSINIDLKDFEFTAKPNDYLEVTEWTNGEGVDVDINGEQKFSVTWSELDAIKVLAEMLNYNIKLK